MPNVTVNVAVDGNGVFVHSVANTADVNKSALAGLQAGIAHFQDAAAAVPARPAIGFAAKPQDNSL